jgi:hypothetical protein
MRKARDPRLDPKPGDELFRHNKSSLSGGIFRKVVDVRGAGHFILIEQDNGFYIRAGLMDTKRFIRWAKKAEIIHAAKL